MLETRWFAAYLTRELPNEANKARTMFGHGSIAPFDAGEFVPSVGFDRDAGRRGWGVLPCWPASLIAAGRVASAPCAYDGILQ
jgi:hypothetical protein